MCGIIGILYGSAIGARIGGSELLRTRDQIIARGPDGAGCWVSSDSSVGLGHRRLAIIDLSEAGAQPMASADGRLTVTFNGKIYNCRELRAQLTAQGVQFRSQSDTEVLLHLYALKGEAMVQELRGMYGLAIWDDVANTLFLARDPYGIRPLYYAESAGTFRFASQVKALLAGGEISRSVEPAALAGFLVWGGVPEPLTFYQGIRALPAGHTLLITPRGAGVPRQLWDLAAVVADSTRRAEGIPPGQEMIVLRDAFRDAVRAHLVADVPVGAFLSAGLDSSSIVGFAKELAVDIRTITFNSKEFRCSEDEEGSLPAEVARHLGVSHHRRMISPAKFDKDIGAFLESMDQPTIGGLNTWFVSKAAKDAGMKVELSGLGGDELFGSYSTFRTVPAMSGRYRSLARCHAIGNVMLWLNSTFRRRSSRYRPMQDGAVRYGGTIDGAYLLQRGWIPPWELQRVILSEIAREGLARLAEAAPLVGDSSQQDLNDFGGVACLAVYRYMRNQLLRDSDWTDMAHSLEIRVPMVDIRPTERAIGIAATGRMRNGKAALAGLVPHGLPAASVNRPKAGCAVPIWVWPNRSASASARKRNRFLANRNVGSYRRRACCVLASLPEAAKELR